MKVSVIGCGYLGAVHAAAMAALGHHVVGVDVDAAKIAKLAAGEAPFFEPELPELLAEQVASGRLAFSTDYAAVNDAQVHFLAVGTPQTKGSQAADLTYVYTAIDALAPHLAPGSLVAGKSTVPVGTAAKLSERVKTVQPEALLAWNPEFLREGYAVKDTLVPDRIVYGLPADAAEAAAAKALLDGVYAEILDKGIPLIATDCQTAELVKVAANSFLATKISFINAIAEICDRVGADVTRLADAIGLDDRIGRRFLNAGVGFGGGCLPKDLRAFIARAEELGMSQSLSFLREVDEINLRQRDRIVTMVLDELGKDIVGRRVAVLGLAFKPNSDDVRDSPALDIAVRLNGLGLDVVATDPEGIENARLRHPQLNYVTSWEEALSGAEVAVVVTEWKDYKCISPEAAAALVSGLTIIDGRNCLDAESWTAAGWRYIGMGRRES